MIYVWSKSDIVDPYSSSLLLIEKEHQVIKPGNGPIFIDDFHIKISIYRGFNRGYPLI
jgi:hypothetical protein